MSHGIGLPTVIIQPKENPSKNLSLAEVVMGYMYPSGESIGGPVIGTGKYIAKMTMLDPETGAGNPAIFETFGAQGVDIELNALTGEIAIKRMVSAFDIGKAINPQLCDNQVVGGSVMALSIAMSEKLQYSSDGHLLNPNFVDYIVSRCGDIPEEFSTYFVENPQGDGPHGARGIGELTMLGAPAALGNAIADAIGVEVFDLPLTAELVWSEIQKQKPDLLTKLKQQLLEEEL